MPLRIQLELHSDTSIAPPSPEQLHAVACSLLDSDDDHHAATKPFSVQHSHATATGWRLDLGLLQDGLLSRLDRSLHRTSGIIRFGRDALRVHDVLITRHATWEELADRANSHETITVRFTSPTFFRRQDHHSVLPTPSVVFGHWRHRWHRWAGIAPHCPFDNRQIHISHLDMKTKHLTYLAQPISGVIGEIAYDISDLPPEHRAAMDALAQLAPYAGCGSRTTAGFGITEILPRRRR